MLTEDIIHWLELMTEILSFLHIFSVRKTTTQLFKYFRKSTRKSIKNYISDIFWTFKSKLQILHATAYIAPFLPDSNKSFLYVYHISITVSNIFSFCVFIFTFFFLLFSPRYTFYNLQCLI